MITADQGLDQKPGPRRSGLGLLHPSSLNMFSPTQGLLILNITSAAAPSWGPNPEYPKYSEGFCHTQGSACFYFQTLKKFKITYICRDTASPQSCCWLCPNSARWGPLRRQGADLTAWGGVGFRLLGRESLF